jgi:hypothetical protein
VRHRGIAVGDGVDLMPSAATTDKRGRRRLEAVRVVATGGSRAAPRLAWGAARPGRSPTSTRRVTEMLVFPFHAAPDLKALLEARWAARPELDAVMATADEPLASRLGRLIAIDFAVHGRLGRR